MSCKGRAIALAGDIRSLEIFWQGGGGAMEVTCSAVLKTSFIADVGYITYQILG